MSIQKLVMEVKTFFENVLEKPAHIIGVEQREGGWIVMVETVEESDYMRKRALDDIVGVYEVMVNENMEIVSYKRTSLRERDEIGGESE